MARIRTIKPEFWTDPFLVQLDPLGRLIFMALVTSADDHGYIPDEPERVTLEVMPREDSLIVDHWIQFFEAAGKLERYVSSDGANYLKIRTWEKHQRVDKPSQSKIFREGSRKLAIPLATRRSVAEKYGCKPGEQIDAACYYCGAMGGIYWPKLRNGRPGGWVTFPGLELDHVEAESSGGGNGPENIVLACRYCNRSKGTQHWFEYFGKLHNIEVVPMIRESSRGLDAERKGKEGKGNIAPEGADKRDLLWEAMLTACGIDLKAQHTNSERGAWNKALKELKTAGATPEEVAKRCAVYRQKWPGITITPNGLAKHWSECAPVVTELRPRKMLGEE